MFKLLNDRKKSLISNLQLLLSVSVYKSSPELFTYIDNPLVRTTQMAYDKDEKTIIRRILKLYSCMTSTFLESKTSN